MITAARLPEMSEAGIRKLRSMAHAATVAPLFEGDSEGKERRWTFTGVLERLRGIREETVNFNHTEVVLKSPIRRGGTTPDEEQQRLLDLLGVRL